MCLPFPCAMEVDRRVMERLRHFHRTAEDPARNRIKIIKDSAKIIVKHPAQLKRLSLSKGTFQSGVFKRVNLSVEV